MSAAGCGWEPKASPAGSRSQSSLETSHGSLLPQPQPSLQREQKWDVQGVPKPKVSHLNVSLLPQSSTRSVWTLWKWRSAKNLTSGAGISISAWKTQLGPSELSTERYCFCFLTGRQALSSPNEMGIEPLPKKPLLSYARYDVLKVLLCRLLQMGAWIHSHWGACVSIQDDCVVCLRVYSRWKRMTN